MPSATVTASTKTVGTVVPVLPNYGRLLLLIILWVSGWGLTCLSVVQVIKAYDADLSIQFFLRNIVIKLFLPMLLLAAFGLGFGAFGQMYMSSLKNTVKPAVNKTRQLTTNLVH